MNKALQNSQIPQIEIAMSDPLARLRLKMVQKARGKVPVESDSLQQNAWIDEIEQAILQTHDDKKIASFAIEKDKALKWLYLLQSGQEKEFITPPNPDSPYSKLLWAGVVIQGMDKSQAVADESAQAKDLNQRKLYEQLAQSDAMQRMLNHFCVNASNAKRGISPYTTVQYGVPNSWFSCASEVISDENGESKETTLRTGGVPHINLDILYSLILGDFVEPVFEHEMEHAEKTKDFAKFEEFYFKQKKQQKKPYTMILLIYLRKPAP